MGGGVGRGGGRGKGGKITEGLGNRKLYLYLINSMPDILMGIFNYDLSRNGNHYSTTTSTTFSHYTYKAKNIHLHRNRMSDFTVHSH